MISSFKKISGTFIMALVITGMSYAQSPSKNINFKEISGILTYDNSPLENVNISIKSTKKVTQTNNKGYYKVKVKVGDVLEYSYMGMKTIEIIVEDITKTLNIEMRMVSNELDEVVIDRVVRMPTSYGEINPQSGSISYIRGEDLNLGAPSLSSAIFSRVSPPRSVNSINLSDGVLWDIDGVLFAPRSAPPNNLNVLISPNKDNRPDIDISQVVDVAVLRSLADLTVYGTLGRNGVIVVRTKNAYYDVANPYSEHNPYTNKERYEGDALQLKDLALTQPKYLTVFNAIKSSPKAFEVYQEISANFKSQPQFYLDVANYFLNFYKDSQRYYEVLLEMEQNLASDSEALKALAYTYQKQGLHQKAISIYKKIIKLRPKQAQSFRDLANAYNNNKQFKNAWKIYMNYLYRGNKLDEKGVGLTIYNEMESLFVQKKEQSSIKEAFIIKDDKNIEKDIRIFFEWNSSEAEFILEFVNPDQRSYSFEHSYYANKDIIIDEKVKGYSSMEFFIDKLSEGDWLTNITYLGNKKTTPTYFKTTIYYNWGKANQTKKTELLKLTEKNVKIQLLKLNTKHTSFASTR